MRACREAEKREKCCPAVGGVHHSRDVAEAVSSFGGGAQFKPTSDVVIVISLFLPVCSRRSCEGRFKSQSG